MTDPALSEDDDPVTMSSQQNVFERDRERIHRQMLSSVSHDLKTPLVSIIGSLEILDRMKDKLTQEKKTLLLDVALQESYRLDSFINNILDMAKLENNLVKAKQESAEIGAILRNCLVRLDSRLKGSTVNLKPGRTIDIVTDPMLLSRVICLLLDNAVRYGGVPLVIDIEYGKKEGSGIYIHIRDNGRGIPVEQLEAIFSKYTRFSKGDQQNAGTGLGLPISRGIMKLLGGTVMSGNHDIGGAIFTLSFPDQ